MPSSEYLLRAYSQALEWAEWLGFNHWVSHSKPELRRDGYVSTLESNVFLPARREGFTFLSVYSRENSTFHEQTYGIQVISPFSRPTFDARLICRINATLQWMRYVDEGNRRIITLDLDNPTESRHLEIYYGQSPIIQSSDIETSKILRTGNYVVVSPQELAVQILLKQVDTENFDQMLASLIPKNLCS
ncbi:hypothetical protein KBD75_02695 [Candidatus Woesebacteria bacterium]|nr:hypothetical protein [Candidatus Woesebacteria bacterium]